MTPLLLAGHARVSTARVAATALLACLLALASLPDVVRAALVYSALVDGEWRVHYQPSLESAPVAVRAGEHVADEAAPRLSPDGRQVALELTGRGTVVCEVTLPRSCSAVPAAGTPPVRPAWYGRSGEIVLVQYAITPDEERSRILVTRDGRSAVQPLLSMTGIQDYPDVSPDSHSLLFSAGLTISVYRAGVQVVQQLWVADLVSGRSRPVSAGAASDIHGRWAPDGERIAYASNRDGRFEIWISSTDGSGARRLTRGEGSKTWPTWSPDGTRVMYVRSLAGRQRLWIVDVVSGEERPFKPASFGDDTRFRDPDWR